MNLQQAVAELAVPWRQGRGRGTRSPSPLGFIAFDCSSRRGWGVGRMTRKPPGRFCCCSLQSALRSRPRRALSSVEGNALRHFPCASKCRRELAPFTVPGMDHRLWG